MMKLSVVKTKALSLGINKPVKDRVELVHQIQITEGYSPCFRTREECEQAGCFWRKDCLQEFALIG